MPSAGVLEELIEESFTSAFNHHAAGRLDAAEEDYRLILAMEEHHAPAQHYLGVLLHQCGRHEEGLALMHEAARSTAANADWCNDLGNVLFALERFDEASLAYGQALALRPDDAQLWTNLGATRRAQQQLQPAIDACEQALLRDPQCLPALHHLAEIYTRLGDRMQSSRYQCLAFVLPPHEGKSRELLAVSFYFLGRLDEAAEVCRAWLQEEPHHPIARHMHAAYAGLPSDTVPRDYIERRFDDYADHFDSNLVAHLDYRGPQVLGEILPCVLQGAPATTVLDAGCGTGLCAPVLAPHALALEGVDLSANMLRHAARHRQYSTLRQADVVEWMAAHPARYGLIAACDVLIYCGQLASFFTAAHLALQDGGHLVFTVELAGEECDTPYHLHPSGRFRHQRRYVEQGLHAAGLEALLVREESLRVELQQPVPGLVVVARR